MVDTAGKKLKQARLRKQLSLEEAARATKIRVPRLADLENDDYTNFASMSYVRGFLFIYAKYLGIDVSEYTASLGSSATSVGVGDYEYLSNAPDRADSVVHRKIKHSIWPLIVLGILISAGAIVALTMYFVVSAQRLGLSNLDELAKRRASEEASDSAGNSYPAQRKWTGDGGRETVQASRPLSPVPSPPVPLSPAPTPAQLAAPALLAPGDALNSSPKEVVVKAVKKTWVKISRDTPDSVPIYEDWLYPDTFPLRLRGARFYILMNDPTGLQISKDGVPMPINQPSITIQ